MTDKTVDELADKAAGLRPMIGSKQPLSEDGTCRKAARPVR